MVGCEPDAAVESTTPGSPLPVHHVLRRLALVLALALAPSVSLAADDTARQTIEGVRSSLSYIDAAMKSGDLSDSDLARLRAENDPLAARLQAVIAELTPQLEASRKRLVELTPKSKETTAASDLATDELKTEQAKHDAIDADLRSARALLLQTDDDAGRIAAARRALFARQTFARTTSLLSPFLWIGLAQEAPRDAAAFAGLLSDWFHGLAQRLSNGQIGGFAALALALIAIALPMRWVARRVIARDPNAPAPSRLRRALAALWTLAVLAAIPLAALWALNFGLDAFDISEPRMQGLLDATLDGLRLVALSHAFGRALIAPGATPWRLFGVGNRVARELFNFLIIAATLWGGERIIEAAADASASLNLAIAARGLAAALISLAAATALRRIAHPDFAPPPGRDPWAPGRSLAWLFTSVLLGATMAGYIAFAAFLINQAFFVLAVASALYLVDALIQESSELLLKPEEAIGQGVMLTIGLRRDTLEPFVVLLQGVARLAALVTALLVAFGPLGLPSQDIVSTLRAAYFGFTIGGVTISLSSLMAAVLVFVVGVAATRGIQNWLSERYLPRTRLDAGVSNSIRTMTGYIGLVVALLLGGSWLGLDLQKFALIAGALSVGIGFGLQGIVNNFVSGLILLWERGIRVGDWVVVGTEQGFVRSINARATEIETFERSTLIVPNSTLVTGSVKNWMHTDRIARIVIQVNVDYDSDPEVVREILIGAARAQDLVLAIPAPLVLFSEFGDWALKFQLQCYVDDALMSERVRSELNFDIHKRLKDAGLRTPYPFPMPK